MSQTSSSGRVVTLVAVSNGTIKTLNPGDTSWTLPTNGTTALSTSAQVFSAANQGKLFFADGTSQKYYDPLTGIVSAWTPTSGTLPVDSSSNKPRLIETWRGRTVVSGLYLDPQNWFMSAVNDPFNWNYSPVSITPTQAVAGNNAPAGMVGDVINAMIPFTDDVMVFGTDHQIWLMAGDPMAGGQLDMVSGAIGMAYGRPWAIDPVGTIYFFSNRTGIYTLVPGQAPKRISQPIDNLLSAIDTGANAIRACWDDRFQGCHFFVTALSAAGVNTHYFYEARTGAWWTDKFGSDSLNPKCCCVFDGNRPDDRVTLIGSWDGYVRAINPQATDDDGTSISSLVMLGPFLTNDLDDMLLKDIQAVMALTSGDVTFAVYSGATAEEALASAAFMSGTWSAKRNLTNMARRAGHAIYIRIASTNQWAMEMVRARLAGLGKVRRRGR